ncbi:hypothetical protein LCGC14_0962620, partial [marine sediment metagenome]
MKISNKDSKTKKVEKVGELDIESDRKSMTNEEIDKINLNDEKIQELQILYQNETDK